MAWQTPKTDWVGADGVRNTDMNRIEGNAQYLYDNAGMLKQRVDEALFAVTQRVNLSLLQNGSEFALYENGILAPYIKVSADYLGTGRALVVRKSSYRAARMMEGNYNYYGNSYIDAILNSEFFSMLDTATKAVIYEVNIPVNTFSGISTIPRKVFLLSKTDYNFSGSPVEGNVNPYFASNERRVATYDGMPYEHWTRTVYDDMYEAAFITGTGDLGTGNAVAFLAGVRPAFTLPNEFSVIAGIPDASNVFATVEVI